MPVKKKRLVFVFTDVVRCGEGVEARQDEGEKRRRKEDEGPKHGTGARDDQFSS
jgi:hypothetical protein